LRAIVTLALITGARIGELLALRWEDCQDGYVTFLETKNGKVRRPPISPAIEAVLAAPPAYTRGSSRTAVPASRSSRCARCSSGRCSGPAITTKDVTLHTLRHTALSRMIAAGYDDYTVMEISGHSSTRMLGRYTHPTEERKVGALDLPCLVTNRSQNENAVESDLQRRLPCRLAQRMWWTAGGSNSRPPRCERGALPAELAARML
jgi:integrase